MLMMRRHLGPLREHLERHIEENGAGGRYFMGPRQTHTVIGSYDAALWTVEPATPGWQRVWGWFDDDGQLRAHAVLTGHPFAPWRCTFGIGVEAPYRRQGHGRRLLTQALCWAREQPEVDWVDSWSFHSNEPSLALHRLLGFHVVGSVPDIARVEGQSLGQVLLLLDLRPQGDSVCP